MARKVTTPNSDYFSGGPNYKLPGTYTILFMAKVNSTNSGVLFGGRITDGWWVERNSNSGIGVVHAGIASFASNNNICPNDNAWHAYAITYDGTARFYADDTTVRGSVSGGACINPPGVGIYIGANNDNNAPVWAGDHALAEIALFSRKLSDAELGQWMSGDAPNLYSTNLDHYWRLDETSGGAAATVGGYNLTQVGTMSSVTHPTMNYSSGATATVTGTSAPPAFSGSAQVSPEASITVTTALPAFSGGASTGSAEATITATTASPAFSGSATGDTSQGVITLPVLKNNTGTVLANETGATVHVYAVSTGNKVVTKTGQTTNASGVMTVTDALIVGGTQYRVVVVLGSGAEGLDKVTAS